MAPRGRGQHLFRPSWREFGQRHLGDVDGDERESKRLSDQRLAPIEGVPEFDFNAAKHHRLRLDRRPEPGNVESELATERRLQRVLGGSEERREGKEWGSTCR